MVSDMEGFLSIDQVCGYLKLKKSTLYSMVKSDEITHYRVGRLIRFKKEDVDAWMEKHRREEIDTHKKARGILKAISRPVTDINSMIKKSIAEAKGLKYTSNHGRPDQDKAKKEVEYGAL